MKVQEQQLGFIKKIAELKENNPSHEIHFLFDNDEVSEDYAWMGGLIISVKIGGWLVLDEQIFIDEDEVREHYEEYLEATEEETEQAISNIKPSILVRIAG